MFKKKSHLIFIMFSFMKEDSENAKKFLYEKKLPKTIIKKLKKT